MFWVKWDAQQQSDRIRSTIRVGRDAYEMFSVG